MIIVESLKFKQTWTADISVSHHGPGVPRAPPGPGVLAPGDDGGAAGQPQHQHRYQHSPCQHLVRYQHLVRLRGINILGSTVNCSLAPKLSHPLHHN